MNAFANATIMFAETKLIFRSCASSTAIGKIYLKKSSKSAKCFFGSKLPQILSKKWSK